MGKNGQECGTVFEEDHREFHNNSTLAKELNAIVVEVEATINNCSLTYVYDNTDGVSQAVIPTDLIYAQRLSSTLSGSHYEIITMPKTLTRQARHQF